MGIEKKYFAIVKKYSPNISEREITVYADGWDHIVLVANNIAFRFPRNNEYKKHILSEVRFIKTFINQSPVRIPDLNLRQDEQIGPYAIYPFIQGSRFKKESSRTFAPANLMTIARDLGKFLSALHAFPKDKALKMGIRVEKTLTEWQKTYREIKKLLYPQITSSEQAWITQLFDTFLDHVKKIQLSTQLYIQILCPSILLLT